MAQGKANRAGGNSNKPGKGANNVSKQQAAAGARTSQGGRKRGSGLLCLTRAPMSTLFAICSPGTPWEQNLIKVAVQLCHSIGRVDCRPRLADKQPQSMPICYPRNFSWASNTPDFRYRAVWAGKKAETQDAHQGFMDLQGG